MIEKVLEFIKQIPNLIEKNYTNPFFWTILVIIIVFITYLAINKLGDK